MTQSIFTFHFITNSILLLFATYFSLRFILPLHINILIKLCCFLLAFLLAIHTTFFELLEIHIPDNILVVTTYCVLVIVVASLLAFFADSIGLILRLCGVHPHGMYLISTKCMPFILILTSILCTYGMYQALRVPPIKEITLQFEQLPDDLDGLRIAQLADPHIGRFFRQAWLDKSIDKLLEAKPDIIAISGDAVDAPFETIKNDVVPYNRLEAPLGVYFVAGNHEYINGYTTWVEYFSSLPNIIMLENANKTIHIGNSKLDVVGLTDPAAERAKLPPPNATLALQGLEEDKKNSFRLLLAHRPSDKENDGVKADLQLSGHTHGGILFFVQSIVAKSNGGFVSGLYDSPSNPKGKIYVSNGMAVWDGFPMRLGVDSEIAIITLAKNKQVEE